MPKRLVFKIQKLVKKIKKLGAILFEDIELEMLENFQILNGTNLFHRKLGRNLKKF
ncbi:MAG: hypothetical protein ACFE91_07295 [Promethearchaeota archaeon]